MRLREHPGVKGKIDSYPFDPRLLKVKEGFNVRDLDSPDERPALDELKASIKEHGVEEPLRVQMVGEDVFIVRGHRRHKAVMELIEEGEPIEAVLVIQVPKGVNDAALNIDIVVSNADRKDLSQLQIAEVIARQYTVYKWSVPQIAKAISKTEGTVNNYLEIAGLGEAIKEQVRDNVVSATLAKNIAKGVDPEFAAELIRKNAEENARIKGKRRVTAKTIKRDAPKPPREEPPAEPQAEAPSKEWCEAAAQREGDSEVGAGALAIDPPAEHFVPLADMTPPTARSTPMVAPETASPNQISGERMIDGVRVTFRAIHLPIGQWEVRVVDAIGELTKDIDDDPWTLIALMVEQAVAASRDRVKELEQ